MARATVEDSSAGLGHTPYETASGWWVILPWRLGAVHEFTGTQAAKWNSSPESLSCSGGRLSTCDPHASSGHEAGGRCRPGSLALGVGQLPVIHTLMVAIGVVSIMAPT